MDTQASDNGINEANLCDGCAGCDSNNMFEAVVQETVRETSANLTETLRGITGSTVVQHDPLAATDLISQIDKLHEQSKQLVAQLEDERKHLIARLVLVEKTISRYTPAPEAVIVVDSPRPPATTPTNVEQFVSRVERDIKQVKKKLARRHASTPKNNTKTTVARGLNVNVSTPATMSDRKPFGQTPQTLPYVMRTFFDRYPKAAGNVNQLAEQIKAFNAKLPESQRATSISHDYVRSQLTWWTKDGLVERRNGVEPRTSTYHWVG